MSAGVENQMDELYREVILDHYRKPRNRGELADATYRLEGMNPVCGDEIYLDVEIDGGRLAAMAFRGQGCSISQSSASMMTQRLTGHTIAEARSVAAEVRAMLVDGLTPAGDVGDLEALAGVAKFPARVKCALLGWNVLQQALQPTTTEKAQEATP
jgi:nitrogen fixation protein NifU and related proteins